MAVSEGKSHRFRKFLAVLVPLLIISGGVVGYYAVQQYSSAGSGLGAKDTVQLNLDIKVNHQEQTFADFPWLMQMALKGQFWQASCYLFCANGVTYSIDPGPFITSEGHDLENCDVFGVWGLGACTAAAPKIIWLSTGATNSFNVGDAWTSTASDGAALTTEACASANVITTSTANLEQVTLTTSSATNGISASATSVNSATASASAVLAGTWTFSSGVAGTTSVDASCLTTGTASTAILYAEGSFGPDALVAGNTIAVTWTITRSP